MELLFLDLLLLFINGQNSVESILRGAKKLAESHQQKTFRIQCVSAFSLSLSLSFSLSLTLSLFLTYSLAFSLSIPFFTKGKMVFPSMFEFCQGRLLCWVIYYHVTCLSLPPLPLSHFLHPIPCHQG